MAAPVLAQTGAAIVPSNPARKGSNMTDAEKVAAIQKIMDRHDDAVNDDDGERPFNDGGYALEMISDVLDGFTTRAARDGWLS